MLETNEMLGVSCTLIKKLINNKKYIISSFPKLMHTFNIVLELNTLILMFVREILMRKQPTSVEKE